MHIYIYIYIGFKTIFYVVRHLDSIASDLPIGRYWICSIWILQSSY